MEQYQKPKNFRNESIDVEVGPVQPDGKYRTIKVSDLPYGKRKLLCEKIARILFDTQTYPVSLGLFEDQIRRMIGPTVTAADAAITIRDQLLKVYASVNDDQIKDLLSLCTDGQIDSVFIDTMGGDETRNLLAWILERSFTSEKNLYASLGSILNPTTKEPGAK